MTAFQFSGVIRCKVPSLVIPALLTSTPIGPRSLSTLAFLAGGEVADVPLVDVDPGALLESVRGLVVAAVGRRDLEARILEGDGDRFTNATRSAGHQSHPCHGLTSRYDCAARSGVASPALKDRLPGTFRPPMLHPQIVKAARRPDKPTLSDRIVDLGRRQ